jgi:flavin reductase (DIM6/NTAB) family NADH-FMN oxidoreductase RutF
MGALHGDRTTKPALHRRQAMPVVETTAAPDAQVPESFREAMRRLAASVMIVTSRDTEGQPHGMVASSVIPVSMDPPSMLVAVNRSAGLHPVLAASRRFCVNLLGEDQHHLLAPFSQTALRAQRFRSDDWHDALSSDTERLPWLAGAPAVIDCAVDLATDYGTHTLFVGRVLSVQCTPGATAGGAPLVWLAGQRAALSRSA